MQDILECYNAFAGAWTAMSLLVSAPPLAHSRLRPPQLWTPPVPGSALNEVLNLSFPVDASGEGDLLTGEPMGFDRMNRQPPSQLWTTTHNWTAARRPVCALATTQAAAPAAPWRILSASARSKK